MAGVPLGGVELPAVGRSGVSWPMYTSVGVAFDGAAASGCVWNCG